MLLRTKRVSNIVRTVLKLLKRRSNDMSNRKTSKNLHDGRSGSRSPEALPELALAAIASFKRQKEIGEFMAFLLGALERNSEWLNDIVAKQRNFKCALMIGAGPNRFQLQEIIYPSSDNNIQLEVELRESEDHDKVAIAALMRLNNAEMDQLMKYIKTRLYDNRLLSEELQKGKGLGISFAVLRPFTDKQYRVMERIVIGNSLKNVIPKKHSRDEKSLVRSPFKKAKRVA